MSFILEINTLRFLFTLYLASFSSYYLCCHAMHSPIFHLAHSNKNFFFPPCLRSSCYFYYTLGDLLLRRHLLSLSLFSLRRVTTIVTIYETHNITVVFIRVSARDERMLDTRMSERARERGILIVIDHLWPLISNSSFYAPISKRAAAASVYCAGQYLQLSEATACRLCCVCKNWQQSAFLR
jgi:hypothetical protein